MPVITSRAEGVTSAAATADPHWNNVVLLCKFNNKPFLDLSKNCFYMQGITGSAASDVTAYSSNKKQGLSSMDTASGQTAYLTINTAVMNGNTQFNFAGDFTIEAWIWITDANLNIQTILGMSAAATSSWMLVKNATDNLRFLANGTQLLISGNGDLPIGQWVHVAINRTGTALRMYINGVMKASATNSSNITVQNNGGYFFGIGGAGQTNAIGGTNGWSNGQIDELRITNGVGRYPADFTPPNYSFYVPPQKYALLHLDSNLTDSGGVLGVTWTGSGIAYSTTEKKFGTASRSGGYAYVAQSGTTGKGFGALIGEDYTMEAWVNPGVIGDTVTPHALQAGISSAVKDCIRISGRAWEFEALGHGGTITGATVQDNTWVHIAVSKKDGVFRFFVDGKLQGTLNETTTAAATKINNGGFMVIGQNYFVDNGTPNVPFGTDGWTGFIDEVRFTAGQALYLESFIPPTAAFT